MLKCFCDVTKLANNPPSIYVETLENQAYLNKTYGIFAMRDEIEV